MNNICIIPARTGSKRVPNKNFKSMLGKPIIHYPIEAAKQVGFDRIILSTENDLIGQELASEFHGWVEYIKRSEENSDDNAILVDVVLEVLGKLSISSGKVCLLYPTASLVTPNQIVKAGNLIDKGFDTVFPVINTGIHNQKILDVFGETVIYKYLQFNLTPTQACSEIYSHSGTFFYCDIEKLIENRNIITTNCGCIHLKPWEAYEVDTMEDWKMLEILMRYKDEN